MSKNRLVAKPAAVELAAPDVETDRPSLARLTALIAICFSIGVAWPILGGLNYVQRPPGSNAAKLLVGDVAASEVDPNAAALATAEVAAAHVAPVSTTRQAVSIESRAVQSCQGDAGEVVARCDEPRLEGVIEDPIAKLADCPAADGISGTLSLGLQLDFSRGHVTRVKAGQATTFSPQTTAALSACAEESIVGTPLDDIEHEHGRYWVYYRVRFLPPGSPVDPESPSPSEERVSASGQATIGWTTAVVRESPSPGAKITTRLSYGTRVNVTGRGGDWYRIERAGKSLGWVQRKAIGM